MTTKRATDWIADTDVPGVYISDNGGPPADPRARLAGTGLDVWEVINLCRSADWQKEAVFRSWPYLARDLLEAAFVYYARHSEEIDRFIAENEDGMPDWAKKRIAAIDPQSLVGLR